MRSMAHGVLAGYDGSRQSEHALAWAARAARARGLMLTVAHAWEPHDCAPGDEVTAAALARCAGEQVLARGMRFAQSIMDPGEVRPLLAGGPPGRVLCDHSTDAEMVVVSCRGYGGFARLRLGSVSAQVAAYAYGPVVVVRGHWRPSAEYVPGPVVVGADGSAASGSAIEFAVAEATLREAPLLAVCALADNPGTLGGGHRLKDSFSELMDHWQQEYPALDIQRQVVDGSPREALLQAARTAQLLVVGARGRGGVDGMAIGSVSYAVLHHAHCPVAVIHSRRPGPQPPGTT